MKKEYTQYYNTLLDPIALFVHLDHPAVFFNKVYEEWTPEFTGSSLMEILEQLGSNKAIFEKKIGKKKVLKCSYTLKSTKYERMPAEFQLYQTEINNQLFYMIHGRDMMLAAEKEALMRNFSAIIEENNQKLQTSLSIQKEMSERIRNILDNIHQGVLTFDASYTIDDEFSPYLASIFHIPRETLSGIDIRELLISPADLPKSIKDHIVEILNACVGESKENWFFNNKNLPRSLRVIINGETRFLELDWVGIEDGNAHIHQVLLSVRDLSEQKKLQSEITKHKLDSQRVAEMFDQFHGGENNRLDIFMKDSEKFSLLIEKVLSKQVSPAGNILEIMHTIKGNGRSLKFPRIAEQSHKVEELLENGPNPEHITNEISIALVELKNELQSYQKLYKSMFKKNLNVYPVNRYSLAGIVDHHITDIRQRLTTKGLNLEELQISDKVIDWPPQHYKLINDFLIHALNNTIDHGFLGAIDNNKSLPPPSISISASITSNKSILLTIEDNGAGIKAETLTKLAKEYGYDEKKLTNLEDVLFFSGVSNMNENTLTSGRGIGLTAVHSMAKNVGGFVTAEAANRGGFLLTICFPQEARPTLNAQKISV